MSGNRKRRGRDARSRAACHVLRVTFTAQHPPSPPGGGWWSIRSVVARGPGLGWRTWWGEGVDADAQLSSRRRRSMQLHASSKTLRSSSLLPSTLSLSLSLGYPSVNDLRELTHRRLSPLVLSLSYRLPEPSSPSPLRSSSSSVPSLAVRALQFVYIGAGLLIAIDSPTVPSRPVPFRSAIRRGNDDEGIAVEDGPR